jgi:hypothetical protein
VDVIIEFEENVGNRPLLIRGYIEVQFEMGSETLVSRLFGVYYPKILDFGQNKIITNITQKLPIQREEIAIKMDTMLIAEDVAPLFEITAAEI